MLAASATAVNLNCCGAGAVDISQPSRRLRRRPVLGSPPPMANPISRTAYYTLAVRAADAASAKPIGRDTFAKVFMNDAAQQVWEEFKSFRPANGSNAARHVMIDDHVQRALDRDPAAPVVIIGAGFDTRAFRLKGGRWF